MKIIHLRDQYLRVSFIYFLLKGFRHFEHIIVCREIKSFDLKIYPYANIQKTSVFFRPFWVLCKVMITFFKVVRHLPNDWYAYYFLLRKYKDIAVLHAHMGPQGYYAIPLAQKLNKPLFVTFYGMDMSATPNKKGWKKRYSELFDKASIITVEGKYMKSRMVELGCPEQKIVISKIGIPIENIHFSYRPEYEQEEGLRIFMCATFVPKKGYLDALEMMNRLARTNFKFKCDIVGDGPLKEQIEQKIVQYGLQNKVFLHGRRTLPEIYTLASQAHVFFHPSRIAADGDTEGGAPTIIIEMQALGLPVIATKHADIPNIIPEENYFLADEGDVNQLVELFYSFVERKDEWNVISRRGRTFVENEHSNVLTAQRLEQVYARFI